MARNVGVVVENNFVQGYITDVTGLNFPPNACTEQDNVVFDEKGKITRRLGLDYEGAFTQYTINMDDGVVQGFTWKNAGGAASVVFRCVQIGSTVYFFRIYGGLPVSEFKHPTSVNLDTYRTDATIDPGLNRCSFTATNKYLIINHPLCQPVYVTYAPDADTLTVTGFNIQIRDFEGLADGYGIDERKTETNGTITAAHKYNLFNQGWYHNSNAAYTAWDTAFTTMPSNADVWWYYKNEADTFDTTTVANRPLGNTLAPRGHYVLNLFSQDRQTASGISTIATVTTGFDRPSTNAFFAGRAWYAGLNSAGYANKLWFTQIIERAEQFAFCYQSGDPTSEDAFDLLPSDGGDVLIFEAENIIKLFPMGSALIVFCTNGIWAISGSEGLGFTATDYSVAKISATPVISSSSFVDLEGTPMWWGLDGIYTIVPGQGGGLQVQSITDNKIREFYQSLPISTKMNAKGAHDVVNKHIRWLYRSTISASTTEDALYDSVLNINLLTGAFSTWSLNVDDNRIHDLFSITGGSSPNVTIDVVANNGDSIDDDAANDVVIVSAQLGAVEPSFKLLTSVDDGAASYDVTFAEFSSTTYKDWYTYDSAGEDYTSYFVTGFRIDGQTQNFFQSNYVFVFLEQESGAGCLMRGRWDFTTASTENKWSASQQIYNSSLTNRELNFRRLKVRGKGRALQLEFTSQTGAPFTIVGWSIWETSNAGL